MYGMSEASDVNEESPLAPQTEYARSKVKTERRSPRSRVRRLLPDVFAQRTIYGLSPRMRFDTVFNDLVGAAVTTGKITVYSDGKPWRPVVHVQDVSRAFLAVLEAPVADVHNQAFNVGCEPSESPDYRAGRNRSQDGARLHDSKSWLGRARISAPIRQILANSQERFPELRIQMDARKKARRNCIEPSKTWALTYEFIDKRFTRLKWLRHLLDTRSTGPCASVAQVSSGGGET